MGEDRKGRERERGEGEGDGEGEGPRRAPVEEVVAALPEELSGQKAGCMVAGLYVRE